MKHPYFLIAAAIGFAAMPGITHAQEEALEAVASGNAVLSLSGTGEVKGTPDVVFFNVSVISTGTTASAALQNNSATMRRVFSTLRSLDVAEKDMQTSSVSLQPQFQRFNRGSPEQNQTPRITGYNASNSLRVTYRDLDNLGEVIDQLVSAGANRVDGPNFGLANSDAELDQARIEAIRDARRKADLYAVASNMRVLRILLISDQVSSEFRPQIRMMATSADSSVPIARGEQAVTASVNMMFELTPR